MRSTKADTEKRIEQVYKLLLAGACWPDLLQFASAPKQNWKVSERQLRNYITAANSRIRARYEARADYYFARHMLRRNQLYGLALGAGDFRTALRVLQDEARLEGLYPTQAGALFKEVTQLRRKLAELQAQGHPGSTASTTITTDSLR
jgi:hypothetical protein